MFEKLHSWLTQILIYLLTNRVLLIIWIKKKIVEPHKKITKI